MNTGTLTRTNEQNRLQLLRSYGILDTPAEEELDDITRAASHVCGTPIALISLVDETRQWFKSRVGLEMTATPRDASFCAHAMEVTYTNLPPGNYYFRVIASNNSGTWNEQGATANFTILPAFYQTSWFLLL